MYNFFADLTNGRMNSSDLVKLKKIPNQLTTWLLSQLIYGIKFLCPIVNCVEALLSHFNSFK